MSGRKHVMTNRLVLENRIYECWTFPYVSLVNLISYEDKTYETSWFALVNMCVFKYKECSGSTMLFYFPFLFCPQPSKHFLALACA